MPKQSRMTFRTGQIWVGKGNISGRIVRLDAIQWDRKKDRLYASVSVIRGSGSKKTVLLLRSLITNYDLRHDIQ